MCVSRGSLFIYDICYFQVISKRVPMSFWSMAMCALHERKQPCAVQLCTCRGSDAYYMIAFGVSGILPL